MNPFIVNVKNNTTFQSTVLLFKAFNALTQNNTRQYHLTTTYGGATSAVLDFSSVIDASTGLTNQSTKLKFYRTNSPTPYTQVQLNSGQPFTAFQDSFNFNTNLFLSGSTGVENGGASVVITVLKDDYSEVAIMINNPPSAPYNFYSVDIIDSAPSIVSTAFTTPYNTSAPPVGAGISIENNAYGEGGLNYTEFLRECTNTPMVFSRITAEFSNKADAFKTFTITDNSMNETRTSQFKMQRSPYMRGNGYQYPIQFFIDGFFGLQFQIAPLAEIDLKFWEVKKSQITSIGSHPENMLGA